MPHLSPMNWLFVPVFLLTTLMILTVIMWWQTSSYFPSIPTSSSTSVMSKSWHWW
uniref:ATP synthase F0 subunit 8 n=1 Tax=Alitta succinea TaxID=981110 RepID=A0A7G8JTI0_ALISU|nr:ATP synthase F0 subunit 8 [Alitta succinea]QNJ33878.1 ATP synthase F0 subunit 8 [Alitta succinea]